MHRLKDIAVRLGDCHVRTAKRWWKKLRVPPTVRGHGAHMWDEAAADLLYRRWRDWMNTTGTTPEIHKAKFTRRQVAAATLEKNQLHLPLKFNVEKIRQVIAKKITVAKRAVKRARK